jgi:hypothetical protein
MQEQCVVGIIVDEREHTLEQISFILLSASRSGNDDQLAWRASKTISSNIPDAHLQMPKLDFERRWEKKFTLKTSSTSSSLPHQFLHLNRSTSRARAHPRHPPPPGQAAASSPASSSSGGVAGVAAEKAWAWGQQRRAASPPLHLARISSLDLAPLDLSVRRGAPRLRRRRCGDARPSHASSAAESNRRAEDGRSRISSCLLISGGRRGGGRCGRLGGPRTSSPLPVEQAPASCSPVAGATVADAAASSPPEILRPADELLLPALRWPAWRWQMPPPSPRVRDPSSIWRQGRHELHQHWQLGLRRGWLPPLRCPSHLVPSSSFPGLAQGEDIVVFPDANEER